MITSRSPCRGEVGERKWGCAVSLVLLHFWPIILYPLIYPFKNWQFSDSVRSRMRFCSDYPIFLVSSTIHLRAAEEKQIIIIVIIIFIIGCDQMSLFFPGGGTADRDRRLVSKYIEAARLSSRLRLWHNKMDDLFTRSLSIWPTLKLGRITPLTPLVRLPISTVDCFLDLESRNRELKLKPQR